jgi:hypothetical protein
MADLMPSLSSDDEGRRLEEDEVSDDEGNMDETFEFGGILVSRRRVPFVQTHPSVLTSASLFPDVIGRRWWSLFLQQHCNDRWVVLPDST